MRAPAVRIESFARPRLCGHFRCSRAPNPTLMKWYIPRIAPSNFRERTGRKHRTTFKASSGPPLTKTLGSPGEIVLSEELS